ncbi:LGFP repeat-containing protein [Kutzneria albida]|nr:hypothetical protein [Kutzneria albida]
MAVNQPQRPNEPVPGSAPQVHKNVAAHVTGPVMQARDVYGGVNFHTGLTPGMKRTLLIAAATVIVALTVSSDTAIPAPAALADGQRRSCGGPWLAHGPILEKYLQERARKDATLGCPLGPVTATADGRGQFAVFDTPDTRYSDRIYWSQDTGAHTILGEIGLKWAALQAEIGQLGFPTGDEERNPDQDGRRQKFQHGQLYWHPQRSHGAHPISDEFFATWAARKNETGPLGYPVSDVQATSDGAGRHQDFQGGTIIAHPARSNGAHAVMLKIYEKWQRHGAEAGDYGYPVADEVEDGRAYHQVFERGEIVWDDAIQDYR